MSFRAILALALVVAIAVAMAVIVGMLFWLHSSVLALLPNDLALSLDAAFVRLLSMEALVMLALSLVLAVAAYFIIGSLVANPLRELAKAVDAYAVHGSRGAIEGLNEAPKEILSLGTSFDTLVNRVEEGHKHDVEISRVKSDFISTAAHQLRTPLTAVRWALEALQKEQLTENQKALVESAVGKSKDLVAIVGTLLDISAIESGKYKYHFEPTDMSALLAEVTTDLSPLANEGKVSLFFAHEEGAQVPPAKADRERVKWVLNNLVENAIQYTPEGGSVRLSVEPAPGRVQVKVKDTGIGILAEDRANIFERFYRAQNAISKKNQGNGLGLYIARTIATDHGGDLNFASNTEGPGTTFTFSLPTA